MMGALNQGCLDNNGNVEGVIHEMWMGETEETRIKLIPVGGKNLTLRKERLVEGADAIITLPGGTGTFEEFLTYSLKTS
eukprot:UN21563